MKTYTNDFKLDGTIEGELQSISLSVHCSVFQAEDITVLSDNQRTCKLLIDNVIVDWSRRSLVDSVSAY